MKKILLSGFLLLMAFPLFSQDAEITLPADSIVASPDSIPTGNIVHLRTVIRGTTTPERYGAALELRTSTDGLTNAETVLANAAVGSQGEFRFDFTPAFAGAVFIPLDAVNGFMFVEKNKTYNIALPPLQKRTRAELFNPYFRPAAMILSIVEPDKNDLTVQISAFEDTFDQYYMRSLVSKGNRDSIGVFIEQMQLQTGVSKSRFLEDYKKFRYALLAFMVTAERPEWALSFINQTDIDEAYASPAFWEAFNLIFDNFFSAFPLEPEQQDIEHALRQKDMEMMNEILKVTFEIKSETLRQLVIINGLLDLYNRDTPDEKKDIERRAALLSMLEQYSRSGLTAQNSNIAQAVIAKLKKINVGEPAFNFHLPDERGKMVSLSDFAGNYVYLHFVNAFITSSKRDLQVLSQFEKRYPNFKVVNIYVYNAAEDLQAILPEFKRGMTNLHWNNNAALLDEYEVRNIPTFYLIGPDGKFVFSPAPSPGEGFEEKFSKMMMDKEKEQQLRK